VLQDIVNELGRRLEYDVTNGCYQGTPNAVGFDGIWCDPSGYRLVIEVKMTDAYRLSLDTIARYRDQLLSQGTLARPCSILIFVKSGLHLSDMSEKRGVSTGGDKASF
jgi:hypothetical protein